MKFTLSVAFLIITCFFAQAQSNTFPSSGSVGIGTTSPVYKLHVNSSVSAWTARFQNTSGYIDIGPANNGGAHIYTDRDVFFFNKDVSLVGNPSRIRAYASNNFHIHVGGADRVTIASGNGNVGIGNANPVNTLQIGPNPNVYNGNDLVVSNTHGSFAIHNKSNETYLWGSRDIAIRPGGSLALLAKLNGNVGIGTTSPDSKLTVKGVIHAEEVKLDLAVPGPDYVFDESYPLRSLEDTKTYIDRHKHLPGIPSSDEMQANGVNLLEMNMKLLEKVEELTLHLIEQNKRIRELEATNSKDKISGKVKKNIK